MSRTAFLRLFLLLAISAVTACSPPAPKFKAMDIAGIGWGDDFELTAHTGKRVKVSDFKGKVVILFFGYTHCPDICAPTLSRLAALMKRLGPDAARVQVLFVTVDPEHDTVKQLAGFVPQFAPAFIGLTGSEQEIAKVAQDYKVAFGKNPANQPGQILVDHSTGILVKDAKGALRLLVKNDMPVEDLEHDIRVLLKE